MVKDEYIYWVKKDLFECFRIEEIRDKDNETGFERGRRNRNQKSTVLPYTRCSLSLRSLRLKILTRRCNEIKDESNNRNSLKEGSNGIKLTNDVVPRGFLVVIGKQTLWT